MRLTIVTVMLILGAVLCDRERPYINFKLIKIKAQSLENLERILETQPNVDVLGSDLVSHSVVVIVSPDDVVALSRVVSEESAEWTILHNNLQDQVDDEYRQTDMRSKTDIRRRFSLKDLTNKYMTLNEIYGFQKRIAASCRGVAKVKRMTIGYSANRKPIVLMKISKANSPRYKKTIFIESGIHAREWLSPAAANYIIYQLACNKQNKNMLNLFNWEIISILNPDGYAFSFTKGHRYWRKNRQKNVGSGCVGTDLNRNFATGFGGSTLSGVTLLNNGVLLKKAGSFVNAESSSNNMCSETYRGRRPYSAPETTTVRNHIMRNRKHIISYLSVHTYGQYILLPWGYKTQRPPDYQKLKRLAQAAVSAMGIPFKVGNTFPEVDESQSLGRVGSGGMGGELAGGISHDFARDKAGISLSYTWELMPKSWTRGFAVSETMMKQYMPVIWRGIRAYARAVANQKLVTLG